MKEDSSNKSKPRNRALSIRSKQIFLVILVTIGTYLFLAGIALFRQHGGLHPAWYTVGVAALAGVLGVWWRLDSAARSHWQMFSLAGKVYLLILLGWGTYGAVESIRWKQHEPDRRAQFHAAFKKPRVAIEWIREKGFPEPVGIRFLVELELPPLDETESWATIPRLALLEKAAPIERWGSEAYYSSQIFGPKPFFQSNLPKTQRPRLLEGLNKLTMELFPSFIRKVSEEEFCINTNQSSLTQVVIPTIPQTHYLPYVSWPLGNQAELGRYLREALPSDAVEILTRSINQFHRLRQEGGYVPSGSDPKSSGLCYWPKP